MASLLEDPGYIHSAGPEEILDPRTTCLLGLCVGNSTMGCLNDLYTQVKKGKQSLVSRHNQLLGKGVSDLFVPSCVYQMYTLRWTFAFPFYELQQIFRLVSAEGKEIAKNCCCTTTVVTRREGLQMRSFCRFLHQQKLECLWEGCRIRQHGVSCIMSDKKALKEVIQEWTPVHVREANLQSPSCHTMGPSASEAMVHWTDQNLSSWGTLVPEQNLGLGGK